MSKYINADKFKELVHNSAWWNDADAGDVLQMIDDFPMEDVAPVIHAHWEQNESGKIRCSYCKHKMHLVPESNYACEPFYCAFCGAKMDEEVKQCINHQ